MGRGPSRRASWTRRGKRGRRRERKRLSVGQEGAASCEAENQGVIVFEGR